MPTTLTPLPAEKQAPPPLASHKIPAAPPEPVLVYVEPGPDWLSFVAPSRRSDAYYLLVTLALLGLLLLGR